MATNPLYSASDYALPTAGQTQYDADMAAAKKQAAQVRTLGATLLAEQQQREKKSAEDVYGKALGNMYEGDRALVQQMRDYVQEQQENGGYAKDPVAYQKAVAQLNAMTDNFSSFYNQSYGTDSADGTGNTYADILYNQRTGNDPYEGKGERPVGNPFEDAQSTLNYMQSGGYDPESVYITEEGVMMARTVDTNGNIGEYYPVDQLPHRQLGSQAFMVETVADAAPTLLERAESEGVRNSITLAKSRIPAGGQAFDLDGFNGSQYDMSMVRQDEKGREFRRSVIDDPSLSGPGLNLTPEERQAFINGDFSGPNSKLYDGLISEGRDAYIEYTRYGGVGEGGDKGTGDGGGSGKGAGLSVDHSVPFGQDLSVAGPPSEEETERTFISYGETIKPMKVTSEYGDYTVTAIDQDHLGNSYVGISSGINVPYKNGEIIENPTAEEWRQASQGLPPYSLEEDKALEWVQVSGEGTSDERAGEIMRNLQAKGHWNRMLELGANTKKRFDAVKSAEDAEKKRQMEIAAPVEPDPDAVQMEDMKFDTTPIEEPEDERTEEQKEFDEMSDYNKQFYRRPGEEAPEFNIWGEKTGGGREFYRDQPTFKSTHGKVMKDYMSQKITEKYGELDPQLMEDILNSPQVENALNEEGFDAGAAGGEYLQKTFELIGQGSYPEMRKKINSALDKLEADGTFDVLSGRAPTSETMTEKEARDRFQNQFKAEYREKVDPIVYDAVENHIFKAEGHYGDNVIAVPDSENSGITIAGLDLGPGAGDNTAKLEILDNFLSAEDMQELRNAASAKGPEAKRRLEELQKEGFLTVESLGLSDDDVKLIQSMQTEKVIKKVYEAVGGKEEFEKIPESLRAGIIGVQFNVEGPNTLESIKEAIKSGDWTDVVSNYMNYYGSDDEVKAKLKNKRILPGNVTRAENVGKAIAEYYGIEAGDDAKTRGII